MTVTEATLFDVDERDLSYIRVDLQVRLQFGETEVQIG